jgi:hypothetical protein
MPSNIVMNAAVHIVPVPIHAIAVLCKCFPARDKTINPSNGSAGIRYKY